MELVAASLLRLFLKLMNDVIAGIKRIKPAPAEAAKLIQPTAAYLEKHSKRLDCGPIGRGGFHIRSGAIDSANKLIPHCPDEAAWGMVVSDQRQQNPHTPMCQVQRHLRESNGAAHRLNDRKRKPRGLGRLGQGSMESDWPS